MRLVLPNKAATSILAERLPAHSPLPDFQQVPEVTESDGNLNQRVFGCVIHHALVLARTFGRGLVE